MAYAHPERVASLTSINVGVVCAYRWHYRARIWRTPGLGELFMAPTPRSGFHRILRRGDLRGLPRAFIDEMSDNWDAGTRHAILRLYRATNDLGAAADLAARGVRPLELDCLMFWGECDAYLASRYSEAWREFPLRGNRLPRWQRALAVHG